jgi:hypothetical protein
MKIMKYKVSFLCLLVLLSISCKKQTLKLDDIILQCFDPNYQEQGIDIKSIIDKYEQVLVKEGVLRDASGKSYLEVLQKMYSDKEFRITSEPFMDYDPTWPGNLQTDWAVRECERKMIDLLKEKDSKWHQVFPDSDISERAEDPDLMLQTITETMSEEDLNSYYFRLKMFQIFDGVNTDLRNRSSMPPFSTE